MFFSRKKSEDHNLCVIDVGSGTVAGAFVDIVEGDKPNINFTFRSQIKEAVPGVPYERYFFSMIASLEEVMRKLSHNSKKLPKEIVVYFRSPWLASTSRVIKKQNKKSFVFDKKVLDKIVSENNQEFINELIDSSVEYEGYEIIEQRIEGVKINGYEVKKLPRKINADSVTVRTFLTVAPTNVLNAIEDVILSEFGIEVSFKSFSRSICNLSKQFAEDLKDYILFDVGSLITEISVIRNCQVVETMTLPQGYAHINQELYKGDTITKGIVEASTLNHAHPIENKKIENLTNEAKKKWVSMVSETLDKFSTQLSLPSTLVLMTEDSNPLFFANMLKDESFAQYLVTDKKFNVIIMNTSAFENICTTEGCKPDALLMAEAIDIKNKYYA